MAGRIPADGAGRRQNRYRQLRREKRFFRDHNKNRGQFRRHSSIAARIYRNAQSEFVRDSDEPIRRASCPEPTDRHRIGKSPVQLRESIRVGSPGLRTEQIRWLLAFDPALLGNGIDRAIAVFSFRREKLQS